MTCWIKVVVNWVQIKEQLFIENNIQMLAVYMKVNIASADDLVRNVCIHNIDKDQLFLHRHIYIHMTWMSKCSNTRRADQLIDHISNMKGAKFKRDHWRYLWSFTVTIYFGIYNKGWFSFHVSLWICYCVYPSELIWSESPARSAYRKERNRNGS